MTKPTYQNSEFRPKGCPVKVWNDAIKAATIAMPSDVGYYDTDLTPWLVRIKGATVVFYAPKGATLPERAASYLQAYNAEALRQYVTAYGVGGL